MSAESYGKGLDRCEANHVPLTPLGFLDRAALAHPKRLAVVHGDLSCREPGSKHESVAIAWPRRW